MTDPAKIPTLEELENGSAADLAPKVDSRGEMVRAAVALRVAGAPYGEIARLVGYPSAQSTRNVVLQALGDSATEADIAQVRNLSERRLNQLLTAVWAKATKSMDPDKPADPDQFQSIRLALAIIDRHARLMGVDAPTQMVVHTPDQRTIIQWVTDMANQVRPEGVAEEADIVEVEIVKEIEEKDPDG